MLGATEIAEAFTVATYQRLKKSVESRKAGGRFPECLCVDISEAPWLKRYRYKKVIRVNEAQMEYWRRICTFDNRSWLWSWWNFIVIFLPSLLASIVITVLLNIGTEQQLKDFAPIFGTCLRFSFLSFVWVIGKTIGEIRLIAERNRQKEEFLRSFGCLPPDEVGTVEDYRCKYVLLLHGQML